MPINFDLSKYKNELFIETGTLYGGGTKKALEAGFDFVCTIEIHPKYYNISQKNLAKEIEEEKACMFLADSKEALENILPDIDVKFTIFLDAHWHKNREGMDCSPLYGELDILKKYPKYIDTILIDDKRMLGRRSWGKTIEFDKVLEKLKEINPDFFIMYETGLIEDDIIVATLKKE